MKLVILSCFVFAVGLSSGSEFVKEIKLFDAVNLTNATDVMPAVGKLANYSAYTFGPQTKDLIINSSVSSLFARQAFMSSDFTVKGYLRTSSLNSMAIISLSDSAKKTPLFNVLFSFVSSAYTKVEFQVEFLSEFKQEELIKSNSIMLDKASKNEWLYFTVRVHIQEKLIRFGIDNRFFEHSQKIQAINKFPVDGVLRIAQLTISGNENIPEISNRFLGELQDVSIHFGDLPCNEVPPVIPVTVTPTACPTQPNPVDDQCIGNDGKKYTIGDKWNEGPCVTCNCEELSGTKVRRTFCMQFCKVCTYEGQYHRDDTTWESSSCEKCSCKDGRVACRSTRKVKKRGCDQTCPKSNNDLKCQTETDGCFCPGDEVLRDGKCETRLSCPCQNAGKTYRPGYSNYSECKYCRCSEGIYSCLTIC